MIIMLLLYIIYYILLYIIHYYIIVDWGMVCVMVVCFVLRMECMSECGNEKTLFLPPFPFLFFSFLPFLQVSLFFCHFIVVGRWFPNSVFVFPRFFCSLHFFVNLCVVQPKTQQPKKKKKKKKRKEKKRKGKKRKKEG